MMSSLARPRHARDLRRVPLLRDHASSPLNVSSLLLVLPALHARELRRRVEAIRAAVREWRVRNEPAVLRELSGFLSIPNLASDSVSIRRNADTLVAMLARRGIAARRLETP